MCLNTSLEAHKEKTLLFYVVIYFREMCRVSVIEMTRTEMALNITYLFFVRHELIP